MNEDGWEKREKTYKKPCSVCDGLRYKIPIGTTCPGCGHERNPNTCPRCAGLPERVQGAACRDCGTGAGKNPEYPHRKSAYLRSSGGWGNI